MREVTVYHPPQRPVPSRVLVASRWISATFHPPRMLAFEDHLTRQRGFVPLTEVDLGTGVVEFLALRTTTIQAVVPEGTESDPVLAAQAEVRPRAVSFYLEHAAIHGTLELAPSVRTSDFLGHHDGFITLRRCRVVPPIAGRVEPLPVALVNARAVIAVSEEGGEVPARASAAAEGVPA